MLCPPCLEVYTHGKRHNNAKAQLKAWMHKCDFHFFASDIVDEELGAVILHYPVGFSGFKGNNPEQEESLANMWNKVIAMWREAYRRARLFNIDHIWVS